MKDGIYIDGLDIESYDDGVLSFSIDDAGFTTSQYITLESEAKLREFLNERENERTKK